MSDPKPQDIWVAFTGKTELWWLGFLKPGFRHCFALIRTDRHWLIVEPLADRLDITLTEIDSSFDLPGWFREQGMVLVAASSVPRPARPRCAPIAPFTCVETVKRLLGLRQRWLLTPYQLFRHLTRPTPTA